MKFNEEEERKMQASIQAMEAMDTRDLVKLNQTMALFIKLNGMQDVFEKTGTAYFMAIEGIYERVMPR